MVEEPEEDEDKRNSRGKQFEKNDYILEDSTSNDILLVEGVNFGLQTNEDIVASVLDTAAHQVSVVENSLSVHETSSLKSHSSLTPPPDQEQHPERSSNSPHSYFIHLPSSKPISNPSKNSDSSSIDKKLFADAMNAQKMSSLPSSPSVAVSLHKSLSHANISNLSSQKSPKSSILYKTHMPIIGNSPLQSTKLNRNNGASNVNRVGIVGSASDVLGSLSLNSQLSDDSVRIPSHPPFGEKGERRESLLSRAPSLSLSVEQWNPFEQDVKSQISMDDSSITPVASDRRKHDRVASSSSGSSPFTNSSLNVASESISSPIDSDAVSFVNPSSAPFTISSENLYKNSSILLNPAHNQPKSHVPKSPHSSRRLSAPNTLPLNQHQFHGHEQVFSNYRPQQIAYPQNHNGHHYNSMSAGSVNHVPPSSSSSSLSNTSTMLSSSISRKSLQNSYSYDNISDTNPKIDTSCPNDSFLTGVNLINSPALNRIPASPYVTADMSHTSSFPSLENQPYSSPTMHHNYYQLQYQQQPQILPSYHSDPLTSNHQINHSSASSSSCFNGDNGAMSPMSSPFFSPYDIDTYSSSGYFDRPILSSSNSPAGNSVLTPQYYSNNGYIMKHASYPNHSNEYTNAFNYNQSQNFHNIQNNATSMNIFPAYNRIPSKSSIQYSNPSANLSQPSHSGHLKEQKNSQ